MEQTFTTLQIRTALGNWLIVNGILGKDGQTPNVDSFFQTLNSLVLLQKNKNPNISVMEDPSESEENVCISCQ